MTSDLATLLRFKREADATVLQAISQAIASLARGASQPSANELQEAIDAMNRMRIADELFKCHLLGLPAEPPHLNPPELPPLGLLRSWIADTSEWFAQHAAGLSPSQMNDSLSFEFTNGQQATMSRADVLMHVVTRGGLVRGAVRNLLGDPEDLATQRFYRQPID